MSQSTNDVYPTSLRLALHALTQELITSVERLAAAFENKAIEFANVLKMGRTQLQDAVPMTLGQEFHAFSVTIGKEVASLCHAAAAMLEVNIGGTAIGTRLNTPSGYQDVVLRRLGEVTGLKVIGARDLIEATSDNGDYVQLHGAIRKLAVKLSKISNDLRLLSSGPRAGLRDIVLPEVQAGSSIMPAKINPVIPEVVNQVCFKVIGNDITVAMCAEAGQLQLNAMEPALAQAAIESLELIANASNILRAKCVDGISALKEDCYNDVVNSIGLVTYLNPLIGHRAGDLVGAEAARSGRRIREVVMEMGLLDEATLNEVLSVDSLTNPRYHGLAEQANSFS